MKQREEQKIPPKEWEMATTKSKPRAIVSVEGSTVATTEIKKVVEELRKLKDEVYARENKIKELQDVVIDFMKKSDTESYEFLQTQDRAVLVQYTKQSSQRFDSTSFKKSHAKLYKAYTVLSESMKFLLN